MQDIVKSEGMQEDSATKAPRREGPRSDYIAPEAL